MRTYTGPALLVFLVLLVALVVVLHACQGPYPTTTPTPALETTQEGVEGPLEEGEPEGTGLTSGSQRSVPESLPPTGGDVE